MSIDIVYENGPIKFFCISAALMLDVSIDTGLTTKKQATQKFFFKLCEKKNRRVLECQSAGLECESARSAGSARVHDEAHHTAINTNLQFAICNKIKKYKNYI